MQAVERAVTSKDWVTIIVLVCFFLLVLLTFVNQDRLRRHLMLNRSKSFMENELVENNAFFSVFSLLFLVFSTLSFSLLILTTINFYLIPDAFSFLNFSIISTSLIAFQVLQNLLQTGIRSLFSINTKVVEVLLISQRSYVYSFSIFVFLLNILFYYSDLNIKYGIYGAILMLGVGLLYFLNTNKKLIISKLFYFILYLCAFKLAPLLVLFKLIL
ncbi:DUF4271 domain-containing protein [Asprobacillus argus]|uniref:DUF4271 domain-containing protein n=1 Tax=Asprobacillus argus TaxID=3076534 RepID=UPI0032C15D3F